MLIMHLSDLHLGRRVHDFPMIEDQRHILAQITGMARARRPDALVIAGDVYDKAAPGAEAVALFDRFLTDVADLGTECFVISGNHDSPERIAFGAELMSSRGVHMSRVFSGKPQRTVMSDEFGEVEIVSLPFIRPGTVRPFFEQEIGTANEAVAAALGAISPLAERRLLIAHQFVCSAGASPALCESETACVGGLEAVDAALFDGFDYVALGHIHSHQSAGRPTVRYCGTPLKYSFSEGEKSVTFVELKQKNCVNVYTEPLVPRRDLRRVRGPLEEILANAVDREDYIFASLTDDAVLDAMNRLRAVYPNVMQLCFEAEEAPGEWDAEYVPEDREGLFRSFFVKQNAREMTPEQAELAQRIMATAVEEDK